ncbi:PQQ-dependent dehydrogenase, methanol/ethanol family [Sphingobium indicum]|uniref:Quinohemoprotein alcohol dehydrogenase n=2 Tax=Sphingobium indicum TaxID=332055 RepID=A0A1L5BTA6_SPHIB|nr:PQQ-dependent dehydrogenase, methanol/ethanol family [Sphingobium indicum]APL96116.1 quinohemoprotein alcohol dehydrogenase [Sphingobium indicum B90A]NYI24113.1 quinohemoprotein ethanol dehydrogenase [Sphingobium indicum]RYL99173.1 PQQ-dependent dehydrogenase, methanol/ethanol family [Sphingobium indicum]
MAKRSGRFHWARKGAVAAILFFGTAALAFQGEGRLVDDARLRAVDRGSGEWIVPAAGYSEQRFSPHAQINVDTVKRLGLAWYADLGTDRGVEATPIVVDRILYNITPWNVTTAYDAVTGREIWRYDPQVPRRFGGFACCDINSRGVAAWKGKIFIATLDGRLIALDARTGKPMWSQQTLDPGWAYTITGAPRVYDGKVIIGNAGAEAAAPGYVSAYDAETGRKLWRFNIVPGDPAKGYKSKAEAMAAKTWKGEWWKQGGGGTAWDSFAYDPEARLVYIGTGNGGPWAQAVRSPGGGDNLFLSSIVAVNVDTGAYVWHYQETPGDEWDYTATQSIILADMKFGGRNRKVLLHAPKNGFFYVLDRRTGELLSAEPYVPGITWAKGIDRKTGRPIVNPEARYGETPVLVSPSAGGGHNWNPMAYSPKTGLAYFPVLQSAMTYAFDPNFKVQPGEMHQLGIASTGHEELRKRHAAEIAAMTKVWLTAWDPVKQKEVWRVPYARRGSGGALVTGGNLVFQGTIDANFAAYRADTGAKLWEMPVRQVPIAGAMSYVIDDVQYVAVNAGWGGGLAHGPNSNDSGMRLSTARLLVFRLDGKATLPPLPVATAATVAAPPPDSAPAAQVDRGRALYATNCSGCHGDEARGGIKDLRKLTPGTRAQFYDIVLGGIRADNGMVSFADKLSRADAEAIHAYLVHRANQDWDGHEVK